MAAGCGAKWLAGGVASVGASGAPMVRRMSCLRGSVMFCAKFTVRWLTSWAGTPAEQWQRGSVAPRCPAKLRAARHPPPGCALGGPACLLPRSMDAAAGSPHSAAVGRLQPSRAGRPCFKIQLKRAPSSRWGPRPAAMLCAGARVPGSGPPSLDLRFEQRLGSALYQLYRRGGLSTAQHGAGMDGSHPAIIWPPYIRLIIRTMV